MDYLDTLFVSQFRKINYKWELKVQRKTPSQPLERFPNEIKPALKNGDEKNYSFKSTFSLPQK